MPTDDPEMTRDYTLPDGSCPKGLPKDDRGESVGSTDDMHSQYDRFKAEAEAAAERRAVEGAKLGINARDI